MQLLYDAGVDPHHGDRRGYADDINALVYRHSLIHRAATKVYQQYKL